jgi:hypothetical protein
MFIALLPGFLSSGFSALLLLGLGFYAYRRRQVRTTT